jgi:hypothetical protein
MAYMKEIRKVRKKKEGYVGKKQTYKKKEQYNSLPINDTILFHTAIINKNKLIFTSKCKPNVLTDKHQRK